MKVGAFSDTHRHHNQLVVPEVDLLVFAGDACGWGTIEELQPFLDWFAIQPATYKLYVPGNHDRIAEQLPILVKDICNDLDIHCLINEEILIEDKLIFGSPRTPEFCGWSFGYDPAEGQYLWERMLPDQQLDLLITHGPPWGIMDMVDRGNAGCRDLLREVLKKKPRHHCYGHIHGHNGTFKSESTEFHNVAIVDDWQRVINPVMVFNI